MLLDLAQWRYALFQMHFRFKVAIFDFSLTPTNGSVQISPIVLLDIKNIGIADRIVLLSCVQAELYVVSYLVPVPDRHL